MAAYYSKTDEAILRALARFQYLTSSQFVKLGITKTRKGIYPALKKLSESHNPEIGKIHYHINPIQGRLESVFYLTGAGARHLVTHHGYEESEIKRPKRTAVSFASDYHHRIWTVNFFITLSQWCEAKGYELKFFSYYFQQSSGSNRNNKGGTSLSDNRIDVESGGIGYIVPDGVAIIERPNEKPLFLLFEQHNGKDTRKFLKQVHGHVQAIVEGVPSMLYGVKHEGQYVANRVFCVFENDACMKAVMHRLAKSADFAPFMKHFCFQTVEELEKRGSEFGEEWRLANGVNVVV